MSGRRRRFPTAYRTRYFSTRRTPGFYRQPSMYRFKGTGRRLFGGRRGTKNQIKRVVRSIAERKYFDSLIKAEAMDTIRITLSGTMFVTTAVPTGLNDFERIGDKTTGTSMQMRFLVVNPGYLPAGTDPVTAVRAPIRNYILRVIVFIWKDDSTPNPAGILQTLGTIPGDVAYVLAPLNHDLKVKRKILMDKVYNLFCDRTGSIATEPPAPTETTVSSGSYRPNAYINESFDLTKLRGGLNTVNFQGGTVVGVNHIYILMVSNTEQTGTTATDTNSCWNVYGAVRYNYIDM